MKHSIVTFVIIFVAHALAHGQSNAFPVSGNVGIRNTNPLGALHVNSVRPILFNSNGGSGVYGSEIGFNSMLNTSIVPNQFIKLGNTVQKGGANIAVDYWGNMLIQTHFVDTENADTVNYLPQFKFTNTGRLGIGTAAPSEKLTVFGSSSTPGVLSLEASRQDLQNSEVGSIRGKNSGSTEITRIGLNRAGGGSTGFLNFWVKEANETPLYEAMRIGNNGNVGIGATSKINNITTFSKVLTMSTSENERASVIELQGNRAGGGGATAGAVSIYNQNLELTRISGITGGSSDNGGLAVYYNSGSDFLEGLRLNYDGNVGVGTATPSYKLQVAGSLGLGTNLVSSGMAFGSDLTVVQHNNTSFAATIANGGGNGLGLDIRAGGSSAASVPLRLARWDDSELFKVNGLGQVSIGEEAVPSGFLMAVDGKAYFEKVVVRNSDNWPDYVFDKSYKLPTLKEVEHHIKNKGYLMDMPSAKEVEGNGQDLSEINKLLLKKIEELTLYVIDISKKNEEQDILIKKLLEK